jgi:drug/metabolite transporter (DMT)-like permease
MGKILMREFSPLQVSWWRYSSALVAAAIALLFLSARNSSALRVKVEIARPNSGRAGFTTVFPWVFAMGMFTFFGSAVLQYKGLSLSTSSANALIVAMEPLFAFLLAWIFLGEAVRKRQALAFLLALLGFSLLSNLHPADLRGSFALFNFGNFLLLLTMPLEAMYSIISRKLAGRIDPLHLFAGALVCGFVALSTYVSISESGLPTSLPSSAQGWMAVLWLGPLGTTLTYIFWTLALANASVAAVSLTLFVQPILGAAFGAIFLGERMNGWQAFGGVLILVALVLQTIHTLQKRKPA